MGKLSVEVCALGLHDGREIMAAPDWYAGDGFCFAVRWPFWLALPVRSSRCFSGSNGALKERSYDGRSRSVNASAESFAPSAGGGRGKYPTAKGSCDGG